MITLIIVIKIWFYLNYIDNLYLSREHLCETRSTSLHGVIREFTQHDAPDDDEPKKSRNERGHAILSQPLARI